MMKLPENVLAYLVNADYDGTRNGIQLVFYEPESKSLYEYFDSDHEPYCLSNLSPMDLDKISLLKQHPSLKRFELIQKYDALLDKNTAITKIITKDPRAIGGNKPLESIRDIVPNAIVGGKVWEADIRYEYCHAYDKRLDIGMPYKLIDGKLIPVIRDDVEKKIKEIVAKIQVSNDRWVRLCEYPVPEFSRVALDIEVLGESKTRVPDVYKAEYPVISASLVGSDGKKTVLLLLREGIEIGEESIDASLRFFDKESDLIKEIFATIRNYPFIITFNGDNFDLMYLYYRALNVGMKKEDVPLQPTRHGVKIWNGIHIDLYRLFFNRSLRNYAFQAKYKNVALDEIAIALLGEGKLKHKDDDIWLSTEMRKWTYGQLAAYNFRDGEITLNLTTYNDDLVMRLILVLMRITSVYMEDLIRMAIGQWIRSMLLNEHRRRNFLIPTKEDIIAIKGKSETKAIIKGKKYKGAVVVDPVAGVHFDVKVVDFASLYPSSIKNKNLGYQTVRCPHEECRSNTIPETSHWVCKKYRAMESEIIGYLRDLRVFHYKKLKKDSYYAVVEQAIKVLLNASYGVFGDDRFSLYCPPVAECTTALGRFAIINTIDKSKSLGIEVLYGDTDSTFLKNPSEEQIKALIEWSSQRLELDLEVDKEYRYVCLSSRKKNYLGVFLDGKLDIKGLSGKKKHIPTIIKKAFNTTKEYFEKAKTPEEVQALRESLKRVILDVYLRIKNRDFKMEEMAFRYTLGKLPSAYEKNIPQHVTAAKMLEPLGIFLKKGESISFVKVIGEPNVKPLQLAKKEEVDINKYHETLQSMFEQILDCLGLDFGKVIGITKLEDYW